ncbi:hypothetical protein LTR36_007038 [Oleoguttula mirabilis]|uniref:GDS1 winged helix domain-containing protein n=1 Tax=Oleoguttula mirabilis TaxID=1507867 RepID=A0AAV9JBC0_9PEZI|nr:hypothetical protein LTR36_007038 [Oleoguttula mirabilis]
MPYNTRRKSLSLSELGIILPKRSRAVSHPSPPNTIVEGEEPPVKKSKRSHTDAPSTGLMSPPRTTSIRIKEEKLRPATITELSPPPSPAAEGSNKVDVEGISDDIVVGTIQQLEKTGNRPHLVKELAYVLATNLHCVEKSANPSALISSRLTAYLHRTWPAISPCPLAKDLSPVHPRRLYFYLTTTPHQPIPEVADPLPQPKRIISPSLSSASAADEEDERYNRQRTALSPSPEVDLSSPELDETNAEHPPTPGGPFSSRNSIARDSRSSSLSHHRRAASPQLEHEERDFKQTASQLYEQAQLRRNSQQQDVNMDQEDAKAGADQDAMSVSMSIEDTEASVALKASDDAAALFGDAEHLSMPSAQHMMEFSSPVFLPQDSLRIDTGLSPHKVERCDEPMEHLSLDLSHTKEMVLPDAAFAWDALQSPENIELAELDDMFDAY